MEGEFSSSTPLLSLSILFHQQFLGVKFSNRCFSVTPRSEIHFQYLSVRRYFICMSVSPASMTEPPACLVPEVRRGCLILGSYHDRWLWAISWVLGSKTQVFWQSSNGAISPARPVSLLLDRETPIIQPMSHAWPNTIHWQNGIALL